MLCPRRDQKCFRVFPHVHRDCSAPVLQEGTDQWTKVSDIVDFLITFTKIQLSRDCILTVIDIKNNIIANLKNQKLPVKVVKDLVDQYIYIDSIIKTFMIKPEPLDLSKYFSPSKRADNYHIHLQQTIENNLNSVLFLKSAQVRTV